MSARPPRRQRPASTVSVSACALQAHRAALLRLEPRGCSTRQGPSLAQRLGLTAAPPPPLSPAQWIEKQQASQQRQDSAGACPICLRAFKAEAQVLLSCSHTFHAACLASFERFSRQTAGAAQRSCPLCRCVSYEKRRIHDAAVLWQHTCATRIQAVWRGVLGRRHARALRRLLPPTHPTVLRRWAAQELGECSKGLVSSVEQGAAEVDALFAELDATSRACHGVYAALAARCPSAAAEAAAVGAGTPAGGIDSGLASAHQGSRSGSRGGSEAGQSPAQGAAADPDCTTAPDWEAVIDRFLQRETPECPICLSSLAASAPQDSSDTPATGAGKVAAVPPAMRGSSMRGRCTNLPARPAPGQGKGSGAGSSSAGAAASGGSASGVAVLSCSHAFHCDCLSAFEAFALASDLPPACPCCRASYQRMDLR